MKISILGAGAWGTAMAMLLARQHDVTLWGRNATSMAALAATRLHPNLPGLPLPDTLHISDDLDATIAHCHTHDGQSLLIVASTVSGLRTLCGQLRGKDIPNIVWLCKGLEEHTRLLPHQIVAEIMGDTVPAAVLSGPSFALEAAKGLPFALTVASTDEHLRALVASISDGNSLRIYKSEDIVGVEIGGAVKNIMAIATGISDGLALGLNARAALMTRGLAEITRLGVALGSKQETFLGLSGVGDLILTCTGDLSRNRRVGLALAQGKQLNTIIAELGQVAEGVRCAQAVNSLAQELGIDMPVTRAITDILFHQQSLEATVTQLMSRTLRNEAS